MRGIRAQRGSPNQAREHVAASLGTGLIRNVAKYRPGQPDAGEGELGLLLFREAHAVGPFVVGEGPPLRHHGSFRKPPRATLGQNLEQGIGARRFVSDRVIPPRRTVDARLGCGRRSFARSSGNRWRNRCFTFRIGHVPRTIPSRGRVPMGISSPLLSRERSNLASALLREQQVSRESPAAGELGGFRKIRNFGWLGNAGRGRHSAVAGGPAPRLEFCTR